MQHWLSLEPQLQGHPSWRVELVLLLLESVCLATQVGEPATVESGGSDPQIFVHPLALYVHTCVLSELQTVVTLAPLVSLAMSLVVSLYELHDQPRPSGVRTPLGLSDQEINPRAS